MEFEKIKMESESLWMIFDFESYLVDLYIEKGRVLVFKINLI